MLSMDGEAKQGKAGNLIRSQHAQNTYTSSSGLSLLFLPIAVSALRCLSFRIHLRIGLPLGVLFFTYHLPASLTSTCLLHCFTILSYISLLLSEFIADTVCLALSFSIATCLHLTMRMYG